MGGDVVYNEPSSSTGRSLRVWWDRPFSSRNEPVLFVRFRYDPVTIAHLKPLLR
jgi:hypothetical protein